MSSRTFTLDEAQDLLPVLESLLRKALDGKKVIESVDAELQAVAHRIFMNGGMSINVVQLAGRKAEREKRCSRLKYRNKTRGNELGAPKEQPVVQAKKK